MNNCKNSCVRMAHPGHQTRIVARILSGLTLILLTTLSFYTALPVHAPQPPAYPQATTTTSSTGTRADLGSGLPQGVGASSLPDLSLPKTVASDVDNLNAAGGVIQSSSQNLTLYNAAVRLRLLGGLTPHEQLLGPDDTILSYWSFWGVEANMSGSFAPLVPVSNNFMIVGANATGTFVIRTMQLSTGTYFGTLKIVYDATSAGPLKWDLQFTAGVPGQYRLAYGWWNITNTFPLVSGSKQFVAQYGVSNYTLSWDDVSGLFSTTVSLAPNMFSLFIDLGPVAAGSSVLIDPSLVSSNIVNVLQNPTAPSFQRKVIYEPKGGYYFAFIGNYTGSGYSYSHDGINWSPLQPMPPGWPWRFPSSQLAVLSAGQSVTVATGNSNSTSWGGGITVPLYLVSGTISGPKISWGSVSRPENFSYQCPYKCTVYTQFASITYASSGQIASSVDLQILDQSSTTNPSCVSRLYAQYGGRLIVVDQTTNCVSSSFGDNRPDDIMSEIVPSDSQGRVRLVYQIYAPSGIGMARTLRSLWMDGTTNGTIDRLDTSVKYSDGFSVTTGNNYSIHIVYLGTDGNVTDASRKVSDSAWSFSKNIFSGTANSASVTSDWSTNDIFALAMMGSSIGMKEKTAGQGWSSILFPVTRRVNASELVSNFLSASATNSSTISLLWSEGFGARYNVMFASIPIQTVWSYGQYFANLGEYVSPSTGMLTVRQTDLLLPGRGLDLEITRLYAEPYSFLGGNVYNYENYTWAPMGVGWQFSFPWMNPSTPTPAYIHLWDGEGYRLPSSFWTGSSATFENHQGEHFRLVRNSTGIELFTKSGTSFSFDPASHALKRISDPLGNNITFSYNTSQQISKIVDTVGRVFLFCYAAGFLLSIEQNSGSCGTDFARRIIYWIDFSIPDLLYVLDPAGRRTLYTYGSALPSSAQYWLITKLTYPTGWYSNYTYMPSLMGTQGYSYRVVKQYVTSGSAPVREFLYNYTNGPGDQVSNSTVTTIDGGSGTLQTISYTAYSFSFAGVSWNVSDANHNFVRGVQQRFGVHGEVPMEIVLVSPTQGYTNYYRYDLWGNQIYSRRVINSSANWYHESFNAYYNDGISPGFYSFQETFRQGNYTATDNYWQVHNGTWLVKNRAYNGTSPVFNPARQEGFFAYTNFTSPSVSIIAMVYITKRTATSDQRVGLLAHYPGSGLRKWALVLHNSTSGMKLSLLDESTANGWRVENPCTLNYNSWYRFNFTLSGSQAWGSANAQGVSCSVSGSFISTDITTATGFGLYAGGYSALFSNVTLTTIAAGITGTVFSNSFIQNGGPNSNVQGALAGTAELQNGTRSAPAETYYSYLP